MVKKRIVLNAIGLDFRENKIDGLRIESKVNIKEHQSAEINEIEKYIVRKTKTLGSCFSSSLTFDRISKLSFFLTTQRSILKIDFEFPLIFDFPVFH